MRDGNAIDAGQGAPGSDPVQSDGGGGMGEPMDAGGDGAAGVTDDVGAGASDPKTGPVTTLKITPSQGHESALNLAPDNPKSPEVFSTKERPGLVLVKPPVFSTKESPQTVRQKELIGKLISEWKSPKNSGKPPLPPLHVVNPSGKKKFGRRVVTGFEILRRVKCACGGEKRLTAGYISATVMYDLMEEDYETQVGIVRQILRRRARAIDARIDSVRCASCSAGGASQGQGVA